MDPTQLPPAIQEALGVFEGFRKLGFNADEIFFLINGPMQLETGPEECCQVLMVLRAQGKEFKADCGIITEKTPLEIGDLWGSVCKAMNDETIDREKLDIVWQKSMPHTSSTSFLMALKRKGFIIPKGTN